MKKFKHNQPEYTTVAKTLSIIKCVQHLHMYNFVLVFRKFLGGSWMNERGCHWEQDRGQPQGQVLLHLATATEVRLAPQYNCVTAWFSRPKIAKKIFIQVELISCC